MPAPAVEFDMRLMDFFSSLGVWNWFIVAVVLFVLETIVPGVPFHLVRPRGGNRRHPWSRRRYSLAVAVDCLRDHLLHHRIFCPPLCFAGRHALR
jgi:hypothetical protein